jgi:hypothetical protein
VDQAVEGWLEHRSIDFAVVNVDPLEDGIVHIAPLLG